MFAPLLVPLFVPGPPVTARRTVVAGLLFGIVAGGRPAAADDAETQDREWLQRVLGRVPEPSPLVHLHMPAVFINGYSVPMTLAVESPMTESEYVREVQIFAPGNPITTVARLQFTPRSGRAEISTRVRLAQPQAVLAVAEMQSGALLMARAWVTVKTNGCE